MKAKLSKVIERILLIAIGITFFSPLVLTAIGNSPGHFSWPLNHPWIGNSTLAGVTVPTPKVRFSLRAAAAGDFQRSKANRFNEGFGGREGLIRITNEVWFRVFRQPGNPASHLVVGINNVLFEKAQCREYFLQRTEKSALVPWVNDLRRLQDFCRQLGMGFVVVVTPSKVAIYPEDTPHAWHRFYDPRSRACVQLLELFRENRITFVDGSALVASEKSTNPSIVPLFPRGGLHWNSRAAWLVANAVQSTFREQNKPLGPLEVLENTISQYPIGDDADLVRLMNLACPWTYPCERLSIRPNPRPEGEPLTMAVVGSSFSGELIRQLSASRQFSEIAFHFYYKLHKESAVEGRLSRVRTPGTPEDFNGEIFGADCLLLEINEASALSSQHHLSAFLTDALARLPDPSAGRPPFRFERSAR